MLFYIDCIQWAFHSFSLILLFSLIQDDHYKNLFYGVFFKKRSHIKNKLDIHNFTVNLQLIGNVHS